MHDLINTIVLGIIEGITEFLPVSSTGHLFLAQHGMGIPVDKSPAGQFWKAFGIVIQVGAILAVVVYFRRRITDLVAGRRPTGRSPLGLTRGMTPLEISRMVSAIAGPGSLVGGPGARAMPEEDVAAADAFLSPAQRWHALLMVGVATLPIYAVGLFVGKISDRIEEHPAAIAAALVIGGVIMLVIERLPIHVTTERMEDITWKQALAIGCTQILAAVFPGTSRSAATIMPGLAAGLSRPAATEFSFFLAIPAMFAACGYKLLKWIKTNHPNVDQLILMGVGTVVAFMVAWVVIAAFMNYIRRHTFTGFAVYRIIFGGLVLAWALTLHGGHR